MTVNTPFLIDDPETIWYIYSGNINIYTVRLPMGEPEGKRFYFFTSHEKQIMMGMDFQDSPYEIGFSADATEDTVVYALKRNWFWELLKEETFRPDIESLISRWLENLFYGISENSNHPDEQADVLVEAGQRLILRKDETISSQRKLIWGKISASKLDSVLINGTGKIENNGQDVLLPVSRRSFLESTRNVGIRFFDTSEALSQEAAWHGIQVLDNTILLLEKEEIELVQRYETNRLQKKYETQFQRTNESLKNAQSILDRNAADKYAEQIRIFTDDAIFNACQIITNYDEISLTPPPQINEIDPIGDIARASRIRYREVKLPNNWWEQDSGAILGFHKENGRPLALMPTSSGKYEAYDPSIRETFEINEETAQSIDALAYTFFKPFPNKPIKLLDLLRFGVFRDIRDFYLLLFLGVSVTLLGLAPPVMTGIIFDTVIPNASRIQVLQVGFALFMALLARVLFELTESFAVLRVETKMDYRLQAALWDRLLNLPTAFFRQFTTGDLADRALGINEIRKMLSGVLITSVLASVFSFLNFFLLFYYSSRLALAAMGLVFIEIIILYLLGKWQISKEKKAMSYLGKTQGIVLQLLTGINKFRVTGTEIRAFSHWLNHFSRAKQFNFQALQIQNIQAVVNVVTPLLFTAVIYLILIQSEELSRISTGEFLAFIAAYSAFNAAMLSLSESLLVIYQIFPIYERMRPILESLPEVDEAKKNPGKLKGKLEVSQLHFRYDRDSPPVIQNLSFKLETGDYVALVGPSGSGKSTLIRLLLGFEKPESGSIFYDDQELSQLDLRLVRRQIGTVLQDGQLIPGDIFSNIVGTSPHLTMEDAWEAAKLAAIDDDIRQMPMAMHTIISEGGTTLSGGQKQRLLIAQTLARKPRLIIFDEATSALDNRTQSVITTSLNKLQATRIVIAHRLSTIQNVDRIYVLDQGKIVQVGTYEELMAQEGTFRELAARQME